MSPPVAVSHDQHLLDWLQREHTILQRAVCTLEENGWSHERKTALPLVVDGDDSFKERRKNGKGRIERLFKLDPDDVNHARDLVLLQLKHKMVRRKLDTMQDLKKQVWELELRDKQSHNELQCKMKAADATLAELEADNGFMLGLVMQEEDGGQAAALEQGSIGSSVSLLSGLRFGSGGGGGDGGGGSIASSSVGRSKKSQTASKLTAREQTRLEVEQRLKDAEEEIKHLRNVRKAKQTELHKARQREAIRMRTWVKMRVRNCKLTKLLTAAITMRLADSPFAPVSMGGGGEALHKKSPRGCDNSNNRGDDGDGRGSGCGGGGGGGSRGSGGRDGGGSARRERYKHSHTGRNVESGNSKKDDALGGVKEGRRRKRGRGREKKGLRNFHHGRGMPPDRNVNCRANGNPSPTRDVNGNSNTGCNGIESSHEVEAVELNDVARLGKLVHKLLHQNKAALAADEAQRNEFARKLKVLRKCGDMDGNRLEAFDKRLTKEKEEAQALFDEIGELCREVSLRSSEALPPPRIILTTSATVTPPPPSTDSTFITQFMIGMGLGVGMGSTPRASGIAAGVRAGTGGVAVIGEAGFVETRSPRRPTTELSPSDLVRSPLLLTPNRSNDHASGSTPRTKLSISMA